MPTDLNQAKSIFMSAAERPAGAARQAYLAEVCGSDSDLRHEVDDLLAHLERVGSFLEQPPAAAPTIDATATEAAGTVIGPYKLLEQIGEGGFGVVFMSEQQRPVRRKVALKVLKPGMDSKQVVARFEAERQALALMDHPNIAKVHDGGTTEAGRPYFVMELVRGVPVTEFCDQNHLTVRERLELFVPVCQAVQHAHQKGIIHRDLKPTNVLVTLHDGVAVPKVIDFGVAKAMGQQLTDRTLFTNFAQMVGTPLYMSPEQAEMSGLDVDTRADIYALGVMLYELLTGTTPLDKDRLKENYDEIRRMIREEEPARPSTRFSTLGVAASTVSSNRKSDPRKLSQLCRGELDWIVMKALEKDRNRRYESASSLAADVQRYLADEPVQACPPSAWYRFRKLARRHRRALIPVSAVAVAAVVGLAALAVSTAMVWRANQDLKEDGYYHRITLAHRELSRDNLGRAQEHLNQCPEELRQWEWHYLTRLCRVEPVVLRHKAEVNSLAFSRQGEWIAAAIADGTIKILNSRTGEVIQTLPAHDSVFSVAFHPEGRYLASTGMDEKKVGKVKVWDWAAAKEVFTRPSGAEHNRGTAYCVAFSPDGGRLAVGSDGAVYIWDWLEPQNEQPLLGPLPGHAPKGISVAFSPDGKWLASGSWTGEVRIWDAMTGALVRTLAGHRHSVSALAFSPDSQRLVSACFDRTLIVWDATTGRGLHTLRGHDGLILGVAFSPDGSRIASTGEDKTVRVWEAATGREVLDLRGHTQPSQGVAFSPDGLRIASGGWDNTVRFWDGTPLGKNERQEEFTFNRHTGEVWTVAVSPDGRKVASAGHGAETPVKVWDTASSRESFEFAGHAGVVFCVAWHPDGELVASAGGDGGKFVVKVWNAQTGKVAFEVPPGGGLEIPAVAFSPDRQYLVTGDAIGIVQVWNARTGAWVRTLDTHERQMQGLAFSPNGEHLASVSADGVIKLWDATRLGETREPRHILQGRVGVGVRTLSFSPDGSRIAAGGEKHTVMIWNTHTSEELRKIEGHSGDVWATVFSPDPDGRWVATAGEDSTVKVWDSRTGELVRNFRGHTGIVSSLAFSPDGRRLFSGSRDKTVKVWDMTQLEKRPGR
jgi:WD40 repeat protein/serine/threonine protein kinase